jgi:two-component system response regulator YesN
MRLLRNIRYKVYEVSEMVGYHDMGYFSNAFKKLTGMTPSEFQERGGEIN